MNAFTRASWIDMARMPTFVLTMIGALVRRPHTVPRRCPRSSSTGDSRDCLSRNSSSQHGDRRVRGRAEAAQDASQLQALVIGHDRHTTEQPVLSAIVAGMG